MPDLHRAMPRERQQMKLEKRLAFIRRRLMVSLTAASSARILTAGLRIVVAALLFPVRPSVRARHGAT